MDNTKTDLYKKVLLIRLGGIGDIVFTLPAVYMLLAKLSDSQITYLTTHAFQGIIRGFPGISQLLTVDRELYRRKKIKEILPACSSLIQQLRHENFDLVVDFQGFGETALLTWLTGAKERWGVVRKKARQIYYTHGLNTRSHSHPVDVNRTLLQSGGIPLTPVTNQFLLPDQAIIQAKLLFRKWNYSLDRQTIFIQPFSNSYHKNWPLANYLALADYCHHNGLQVIFGGGPAELHHLQHIIQQYPVTAGKTDLLTNAGLMALSTLIVGNDTGLLHLAVSLQQRVLMLMGPTRPHQYGPYANPDWAITPQNGTNIVDIRLEEAIHAVSNALSQLAGPSSGIQH